MPAPPPPRPPTRELADSAYAHTSAVLGHTRDAIDAAIIALRKGGRSKAAVLGYARDAALARANALAPDPSVPVETDLEDLARELAFTRPAVERAIVDLDGRHRLDHAELARALGTTPTDATARVGEIGGTWQHELDPALLAYLGPSGCDELAALLASTKGDGAETETALNSTRRTLAELLAEGRLVDAHVETCATCRDRLRAMVSVRTLFSRAPLDEAPDEVVQAAQSSRGRASGAPPPISGAQHARRAPWPFVAAAVVVVAAAVTGGVIASRSDPSSDTRVDALTRTPVDGTGLRATPEVVDGLDSPRVRLSNLLDRDTAWQATADTAGLITQPASGDLASSASDDVVIAVTRDAPEGAFAGTVTFTGDDGSTATVRVESEIRRAPDVAAERVGCEVSAMVQDESAVEDVQLHFRDTSGDRTRRMQVGDGEARWRAALPAGGGPITWWVTAVDAHGNETRTPDSPVDPGSC